MFSFIKLPPLSAVAITAIKDSALVAESLKCLRGVSTSSWPLVTRTFINQGENVLQPETRILPATKNSPRWYFSRAIISGWGASATRETKSTNFQQKYKRETPPSVAYGVCACVCVCARY